MRITDNRQRFLIESCAVRGQLVHLDTAWADAQARTNYPPLIRTVLGEAFAAATLLAGTIKFDGKMTLQIRGTGPVQLLVVQVTHDARVRGLARWQAEPESADIESLFGADARMVITIEAHDRAEPYQGIVPLEGKRLSDTLRSYFRNSEQLRTELWLAVSEQTAAGLLLQKLPASDADAWENQVTDGWQRALSLAATTTADELCTLEAETLLQRLFHEEQVRMFDKNPVRFECSCSRERTNSMLVSLGRDEVDSIVEEQKHVEIICEFCDAQYRYDVVDVAALFEGLVVDDGGSEPTRH
ncbi:MAG: Hsp33 family molecular chaperone HslO [Granulosicoccus sp.]